MNQILTIGVADDQHLFRKGITALINSFKGVKVILEAANGKQLLIELQKSQELPNIVVLDLKMPEMDGIETTKLLHKQFPQIKILILTIYNEERFILHLLECGANAYLFKDAEPEELEKALRSVESEGFYFTPSILTALKKNATHRKRTLTIDDIVTDFSTREKEILNLICKEYTAEEIGEKLFISSRTVEGHRNRMLLKTGCKNSAGLVVFAIKHNLVDFII